MNHQTTKFLSAAGLLHDLGKFAERAGDVSDHDPDQVRQDYRYAHAYHTMRAMEKCFGSVVQRCLPGEDRDATLVNLASRHHKPTTDLGRLLQKADWVASGHERREADDASLGYETEGRNRKSQIPLMSLLGRISLTGRGEIRSYRYRLRTLHDVLENPELLFPLPEKDYPAEQVKEDYQALWTKFVEATREWREKGLDPAERVEELLELLRSFQWCLPASTRAEELPDISLFEHQKGTAAVAAALYQFQSGKENLLKGLGDDHEQKFLLCGCDISGIQSFIYQISSKGAYRHLKGRSFLLQVLVETVARDILSVCGLTGANLLYASGGKAYLLLGNTSENIASLKKLHTRCNQDLQKKYGHGLYLRMCWQPLSAEDLCRQSGKTLAHIWEELTRNLSRQDKLRLGYLSKDGLQAFFAIPPQWPEGDCQVCHAPLSQKGKTCSICDALGDFGRQLGKADALVLRRRDDGLLPGGWDVRPVSMADGNRSAGQGDEHLLLLNRVSNQPLGGYARTGAMMTGGNQHPQDDFESIAEQSHGIKRLGILRMDVDNLGKIFAEGLRHYLHGKNEQASERFYSLGRVTTLSWQLSSFFSIVLKSIVENKPEARDRVSIVYAGGDDLFILGAWDALPQLAAEIQQQFGRYCADNEIFTLSGGIVLTAGKFPIYKGAELAGEAEEQAKGYRRGKNMEIAKRAVSFLGTPMSWEEFAQIQNWYQRLVQYCSTDGGGSLLRHLQRIADLWQELVRERQQAMNREGQKVDLRQAIRAIESEKWCWRMVYSLKRYQQAHPDAAALVHDLQHFTTQTVPGGDRKGIELLGVLCRWVELYLRKETSHIERRAV
jgi:CRISPR-associated protein Csm1